MTRGATGARRDGGRAGDGARGTARARGLGTARVVVRRAAATARTTMASLAAAASATSAEGSEDRAPHAVAGVLLLAFAGAGAVTLSRARHGTAAP